MEMTAVPTNGSNLASNWLRKKKVRKPTTVDMDGCFNDAFDTLFFADNWTLNVMHDIPMTRTGRRKKLRSTLPLWGVWVCGLVVDTS